MAVVYPNRIALSQNLLRSRRLVAQLIERSTLARPDLVVEIGPGRGIITERLAASCRQVLAIEKDAALADDLSARLAGLSHVVVFNADFLAFPLPLTPYKVFANIPFNVMTAVVTKLTTDSRPPEDAYLVVQREAAQRFLGEPRASLRAVLLKLWFEPTLIHHFRRTDFDPAPQVEVVLLRLRKRGPPLVSPADAQDFRDLVVFAFTAWQPTLRAAFAPVLDAPTLRRIERRTGCDLGRPPTAVPFPAWLDLFATIRDAAGERATRAIRGAEDRLRRQQAGLDKIHRTRASPSTR